MKRPTATVPLAPAEGWLTLVCVLLVALTMAWVVDDARWVLGRADYLDHLVLAAVGGVLAGFLGPKLGFGRWATYLVGSLAAAVILPLPTALVAVPGADSIATLYRTTAEAVGSAWVDLAILGNASTPQYLHYILAIGLLVWATSMFASYAVFGHRRPLNGVIAVGLFVVSNMALTSNEQLPFLVLFSLASLFLLIRSHVFDEQSEWIRRQIGDPGSVSSVYLRGGSLFIAVAVTLSFALTMTAASAPLAGAFDGVEDGLINISRSVQRFLPTGGSNRTLGISFGSSAQVSQQWTTDGSPAVSIQRDPADIGQYYWRAVSYDRLEFRGWSQTGTTTNVVSPGDPIFDQQAEDVDPTGRHPFSFTVTPAGYRSSTVLSPSIPVTADAPVRLTTVGPDGYYASIEREGDGAAPYTVTALTEAIGNEPGQLNVNALRASGTDYPESIAALYLAVPDKTLGVAALALKAKIIAEAPSRAPIDLANQLVEELHSPTYEYDTDIRDLPCEALSTVDCFTIYKKGFCRYYAGTMAILLRDMGVPTRIAEGFLPGTVEAGTGIEQIAVSGAHSWVEVYFPGYGWLTFDPTGGGVAQVAPLPSGPPIESAAPGSVGSIPPASRRPDLEEPIDPVVPTGTFGGGSGGSLGPLVAVGALLLLIVGGAAFVLWQRGPRGETTAEGAYGTVTRLASRLGFGPRPTQTIYEYAGALGDVLPAVRPELETVARAKVESVYARQVLGAERLAGLQRAQRRLRLQLLRLAFRRGTRGRS